MSTLLDHRDVLGLPPAPTPPVGLVGLDDNDRHDGFVDCRGVLHRWAEEDE